MLISNLASASEPSNLLSSIAASNTCSRPWMFGRAMARAEQAQLDWYREVTKYQLRLVKKRLSGIASKAGQAAVDDLFDTPAGTIQYKGEDGLSGQQVGGCGTEEAAAQRLGHRAAVVLWFPDDTRLYWQLGELYNAEGDSGCGNYLERVRLDARDMLRCSWASKLYSRRFPSNRPRCSRMSQRLSKTTAANPNAYLPETRQLVLVGGVAGTIIVVLIFLQIRRFAKDDAGNASKPGFFLLQQVAAAPLAEKSSAHIADPVRKEYVQFPDWNLRRVRAKIDTRSARTSTPWHQTVTRFANNRRNLSGACSSPNPQFPRASTRDRRARFLPVRRRARSSGMDEKRPLIETTLSMGSVVKRVRFTLTLSKGNALPRFAGQNSGTALEILGRRKPTIPTTSRLSRRDHQARALQDRTGMGMPSSSCRLRNRFTAPTPCCARNAGGHPDPRARYPPVRHQRQPAHPELFYQGLRRSAPSTR